MPVIKFVGENIEISVEKQTTILEAGRLSGVMIESPCEANGTCGKCKVHLADPRQISSLKISDDHKPWDDESGLSVLACQAMILDDVTVIVENKSAENSSLKVLAKGQGLDFERKPFISRRFDGHDTLIYGDGTELGREIGETRIYGLVIDIGTTTLVASLVDLSTGEVLATDSAINPQTAYAQDVLGRIHLASKDSGLELLHNSFMDAFNSMLVKLTSSAAVPRENVYEAVFSGNTVMLHLACGINPSSLGRYPYTPQIFGGNHITLPRSGLSSFGKIYLPPIISAFVGPDITSGILATGLSEAKGTTLFIDIGTNGEMVLARNGQLAATSTAAGPAFEGMNISCGMRASDGAVESFRIDNSGHIDFQVIGDVPAKGICGSGLLDIVGELVRVGFIGSNGKLKLPEKNTFDEKLENHLQNINNKPVFQITDEVYLNQKDIRQVQLAKGAVRAGIEALMAQFKLSAEELDTVIIAGAFGYHLNEDSLISIGLLPSAFAGKIQFVGNTSQSGGTAFLLNTDFREKMKQTVEGILQIDLANTPDFEKVFVKAMGF